MEYSAEGKVGTCQAEEGGKSRRSALMTPSGPNTNDLNFKLDVPEKHDVSGSDTGFEDLGDYILSSIRSLDGSDSRSPVLRRGDSKEMISQNHEAKPSMLASAPVAPLGAMFLLSEAVSRISMLLF